MYLQKNLISIFFLLFLKINITSEVEETFYNINPKCDFDMKNALISSKKLLLEIMHGKLPFKIESSSKIVYDIDFIEKINLNIPCPYTIKDLELDKNRNGIFIGAGINLLNFEEDEIEKIFKNSNFPSKDKKLIKSLCQKSGIEATKIIDSGANKISKLRKFNEVIINYIIENNLKKDIESFKNNLKTPYLNGFLSAYISISKNDHDLQNFLYNDYTSTSYIIKHLFETAPFARIIQSKLISMMDGNIKYNNNHIIFAVPMLFGAEELDNIKSLINSFTTSLFNDYNFNSNQITILVFNENNEKIISHYNVGKSRELEKLFNLDSQNKINPINLTKIYKKVEHLFEKYKNKNIFQNKIVTLFLNISSPDSSYYNNANDIIEIYRKEGIQTIPFINKPNSKENTDKDIINYNLFCNFTNPINVAQLKMAVSNMHINIDLTDKNENNSGKSIHKKIKNFKSNDIDVPIYFEINIDEGKDETEYYEISLDINEADGYNIFISDNNPYPNIKDYTHKFIKYDNNLNPKIRIKSFSLKQFYIGIEGKLYFDMTIQRKYIKDNEEVDFNEGEYNNKSYNISVYLKDETIKNLETFTNDYRPKSNFLKNDVQNNVTLDIMLKYFTRGIDLDNTDDNNFFNYNLFVYLFGSSYLINTIYRSSENNIYYIGRYIELNSNTPFKLREEGINQLLINKLYPFINGNINKLIKEDLPGIYFNENELKMIYNITNRRYILDISNQLNKASNCLNFEQQTAEVKFILLCLYFQNQKDNSINNIIKALGNKEPKYSEVLTNLINKNKNPDIVNKFLISLISNLNQQTKFEKVIISMVMGQSLILSDSGIKFVEDFYNSLTKAKAKISLSIYNTLKSENYIKTIIPFYSRKNTKIIEMIKEYKKKFFIMRDRYNYTEEQKMDFDKIINFCLSQLSIYDKGIKKEIFIICDEDIYTEDKYYINNKLINLNYNKHNELRKNQIKLILISTKNYEKGQIHELFKLKTESNEKVPYTIYENYFHVNNLTNTNMYINDLGRMAKDSTIKLNLGEKYINDFYQGKLNFYEINCEGFSNDVIVIKANLSNFNFYYSFDNPFPNPYIDQKVERITDDGKIIITDIKGNKIIYLGIESINEIQKQIIEIFSCESYYSEKQYQKCKFVDDHRLLWYALILFIAIFIIGFIIYYCKPSHPIKKSQLNIFD